MAFTEWQQSEIKTAADKYLGRRNEMIGEHLDQVKCEYKIEGQSVIIYEHRKQIQGDGYIDMEIAKATYRKRNPRKPKSLFIAKALSPYPRDAFHHSLRFQLPGIFRLPEHKSLRQHIRPVRLRDTKSILGKFYRVGE